MKRLWTLAFLLFAAAASAQKVNPHSQINWPAACNAPGMVYNIATNTCTDISHVPPANVVWPVSCATGTYVPASNTCVPTGTAANPGGGASQVQYNAGGTFQGITGSAVDGSGNVTLSGTVTATATIPALSPVADVTNSAYGAKGDGTTNAVPGIKAALGAVAAHGGGTVYIPSGTYLLSGNAASAPGPGEFAPGFAFDIRGSHVHIKCAPDTVIDASGLLVANGVNSLFGFGYPLTAMGGLQTSTGYPANTLANSNSATITLTTPGDTSHFAVSDPIYILGGPSIESNGDGEINWITAIDTVGGVLTLRVPTSKPYTGNNSNVGTPGIVTVIPGIDHSQTPAVSRFYYDDSVEGCHVINLSVDFVWMGQVIHGKVLNNHVEVAPTATRGMGFNSYWPMADMEIAGNYYVQGAGQTFSQLADGFRDIDIHDNMFVNGYGAATIINPSQGVISTRIHHNTMYMTIPATAVGNSGAIVFGTAYGFIIDGNVINVNNKSSSVNMGAIILGLSNGVCHDCVVSNNLIRYTDPTAVNAGAPIIDYGSNATISGNVILADGSRYGIRVTPHSNIDYANSVVTGNIVRSRNESVSYSGIQVDNSSGSSPQSEALISGNQIYGSGGANGTGISFSAAGGGSVIGNQIYNLPFGIGLGGTGTPVLVANECTSVTTTTNCGSPGFAQTAASNVFTAGTQDFRTAAHTLPLKSGTTAAIPATCTVGEEYFATDATAGRNEYYCAVTNTWTQGGGCSTNCTFTGTTSTNSLTATSTVLLSGGAAFLSFNGDGSLSRLAAGTIAVGNGTFGDVSGQLRAAQFRLTNSGFLNTFATNTLTASWGVSAPNGNSATVMAAPLVTTAAASDTVTVQGMTASGHCSLTATNATAATNIATTYVSAKTANQITVTHTATGSMNYDVLCTPN